MAQKFLDIISSIKPKSPYRLKGSLSMTQMNFKCPKIPTAALFSRKNPQIDIKISDDNISRFTQPQVNNPLQTPLEIRKRVKFLADLLKQHREKKISLQTVGQLRSRAESPSEELEALRSHKRISSLSDKKVNRFSSKESSIISKNSDNTLFLKSRYISPKRHIIQQELIKPQKKVEPNQKVINVLLEDCLSQVKLLSKDVAQFLTQILEIYKENVLHESRREHKKMKIQMEGETQQNKRLINCIQKVEQKNLLLDLQLEEKKDRIREQQKKIKEIHKKYQDLKRKESQETKIKRFLPFFYHYSQNQELKQKLDSLDINIPQMTLQGEVSPEKAQKEETVPDQKLLLADIERLQKSCKGAVNLQKVIKQQQRNINELTKQKQKLQDDISQFRKRFMAKQFVELENGKLEWIAPQVTHSRQVGVQCYLSIEDQIQEVKKVSGNYLSSSPITPQSFSKPVRSRQSSTSMVVPKTSFDSNWFRSLARRNSALKQQPRPEMKFRRLLTIVEAMSQFEGEEQRAQLVTDSLPLRLFNTIEKIQQGQSMEQIKNTIQDFYNALYNFKEINPQIALISKFFKLQQPYYSAFVFQIYSATLSSLGLCFSQLCLTKSTHELISLPNAISILKTIFSPFSQALPQTVVQEMKQKFVIFRNNQRQEADPNSFILFKNIQGFIKRNIGLNQNFSQSICKYCSQVDLIQIQELAEFIENELSLKVEQLQLSTMWRDIFKIKSTQSIPIEDFKLFLEQKIMIKVSLSILISQIIDQAHYFSNIIMNLLNRAYQRVLEDNQICDKYLLWKINEEYNLGLHKRTIEYIFELPLNGKERNLWTRLDFEAMSSYFGDGKEALEQSAKLELRIKNSSKRGIILGERTHSEGEIKSAKRGKLLIKSTKKEGGSKFKKIIKLGKSDNKRSKSTSEKSKF